MNRLTRLAIATGFTCGECYASISTCTCPWSIRRAQHKTPLTPYTYPDLLNPSEKHITRAQQARTDTPTDRTTLLRHSTCGRMSCAHRAVTAWQGIPLCGPCTRIINQTIRGDSCEQTQTKPDSQQPSQPSSTVVNIQTARVSIASSEEAADTYPPQNANGEEKPRTN